MKIKLTDKADSIAIMLIIILAIPVLYFSIFVPFETDTGDSIVHYFFARYAFQNPMLLLDHWAKPVFTLLSSPFAQFGFAGIKLFNGLVGLSSAWLAYLIAHKLGLKFSWLAIILVLFAPSYFLSLFAGYTEPLFGLILIACIYTVLAKKPLPAAMLISFLPFVRSEGLLILVVFAFYFLKNKNLKAIVLLATGHVVYTIAGILAGKSIFWLFSEIPYQVVSVYGKGNFTHYPTQLLLTLGVPVFSLAVTGLMMIIFNIFSSRLKVLPEFKTEVSLLILGSFLVYFLFHTFSWALGLFGSMGMSRVLNAMIPLLAIISLIGFNFLVNLKFISNKYINQIVIILIIGYIIIFPFLSNPASINFDKELKRSASMNLMHRISSDLQKKDQGKFLYYSNPYLSYALGINPFDKSKHLSFTDWQAQKTLKPNSLVIWDNWFSVVEERTDSTMLLNHPQLKLISRYEADENGLKTLFLLFAN